MRKTHPNLSSPPTIFGGDRPHRSIPLSAGGRIRLWRKSIAGMTIVLAAVLAILLSPPLNAESIDVSTQLPSPQGKYQKLSSTDTTTLATDGTHNVGIGIGMTAPNPSAILDVYNPSATGKGLLIPRISTGEPKDSGGTPLPASYAGFIYYDTNNTAPIVHQTKVYNSGLVFSPGGVPQLWERQSSGSIHIRNKNTKNIGIGIYGAGSPIGSTPNYELTLQGGLLLTSGGMDSTTVSGPGARIMWVPSKKAFRVGQTSALGEWNILGDGSFSAGYNETVKGTDSYSMGTDNKIADLIPISNAIAIGRGNVVNGNNGISLGTQNTIVPNANNSIAIGNGVNAMAGNQLVIGSNLNNYPALRLKPPAVESGIYIGNNSDKATLVIKHLNGNVLDGVPGFVGIGVDSPLQQLHVNGIIRAANLIQLSDVKLKTDIEPFGLGYLEKIKKVEAVSFKWGKNAKAFGLKPGKKEIGVIAQQLETVFPELVQQVEDYKYVDYTKLNVMLVQALNELAAENNRLRQRFEALKKETITS